MKGTGSSGHRPYVLLSRYSQRSELDVTRHAPGGGMERNELRRREELKDSPSSSIDTLEWHTYTHYCRHKHTNVTYTHTHTRKHC